MKVNHPAHYASLITIKHSKVYKVCDQCSFIYLCKDSYESHIELSLCNGNKQYKQQYLKDDKFGELDLKILTENYEWNYSQVDIRRYRPKRRPQTPSKGRFLTILTPFFLTGPGLLYKIWAPMIFVYGEVHIIVKPRNVQICEHLIFLNYWTKICLMEHWKFGH